MHELMQHPLILAYGESNEFGKLLGMNFQIRDFGLVEYTLMVEKKHLATPTAAHGGIIASLLDATVGVAALSMVCKDGKVISTVEMNITFLAPAFENDQLMCVSEVVKKGNRLLFMAANVLNQNGTQIARCSAILNAYPKEKAGY
jgi:uncharacterized protein (TIGR00369 family)